MHINSFLETMLYHYLVILTAEVVGMFIKWDVGTFSDGGQWTEGTINH